MSLATLDTRGFIHWMPDVLRRAGVDVYIMPGAENRSTWVSGFRMDAIIWHHTATGTNWADGHVAALLRDGRIDLKGPLSQIGIERDGTWVFVAMGRANHNGAKTAKYGNDSLGLEFYNRGDGIDPWPDAQVESGITGIAAIREHAQRDIPLLGHKESDPTRKPDPRGIAMGIARTRVASKQATIRAAASTPEEDEDMATKMAWFRERKATKADPNPPAHCYSIMGNVASWHPTPESINLAKFLGTPLHEEPLDPVWYESLAMMNGPLKNT